MRLIFNPKWTSFVRWVKETDSRSPLLAACRKLPRQWQQLRQYLSEQWHDWKMRGEIEVERIRREIHWILISNLATTLLIAALMVWQSTALSVRPSEVKQAVEAAAISVNAQVDDMTTRIDGIAANIDTKNAWIETSTKAMIDMRNQIAANQDAIEAVKSEVGRDRFTAKDAETLIKLNGLRTE